MPVKVVLAPLELWAHHLLIVFERTGKEMTVLYSIGANLMIIVNHCFLLS